MEDRHAEDTAAVQGAMDSNNNDKPTAATAGTGGRSGSGSKYALSWSPTITHRTPAS